MKRLRENRLACGGKRPKAFLGAIIGAVGGLASATIGAISARKQRKQQEKLQERQKTLQEDASMTQAYSNSIELQNDLERQRRMEYKNGGKKSNGISPVITKGGVAIPISSNVSLLRGRSHKTGGIIIGRDKNSIEAENNEVVQNTGDELRIFSAQPILNGNSPAELVLEGYNPNKVFNAQEKFKDMNNLKDDGTKKKCGGKRRLADGGRQPLNTSLGRKQFEQFKKGMRQATVNNREWLNANTTSGVTPYEVNLRTIEDNLPLDGGRGLIALRRVSEPVVTKSTSKQLSTASQKAIIKKKSSNNTIVQKSNKTQNLQGKNAITQTNSPEVLITAPIINRNNKSNNKSNNYLTVTDKFSELPNGGVAATIGGKNYYFPTEEDRDNFLNKVYSVISKRNSNKKSFSIADYFRNDRSIFDRQNESSERLRQQKERRRLYKCGGKTKKAALGMSITGGDILGAGVGALGNIASGIIGLVGANKMKAPEAPTLYQSAKLKTTYNISPQLAEVERTRQRSLDDVNANTASSVARLARNTGINLRSADAINNLYGEKENIETQLINQDRLNAQNVRNQNTQAYNQYLNQLNDFQNSKTAARFNAIGNMVEGITGAAGDIITQGQQRYEDNQKLSAIIGSSERNNLSYLIEAGYQPTIEQLNAAISSAKTQEEIDYYTKIKNRMSKSLFR